MVTDKVPRLSVVMPVHNKAPYLDEAVASILSQSFDDFEFVILDDGSTDGSGDMLHGWAARDPRIRLVTGSSRSGPVASSNRVVAEAQAPLVARMDADDVAHPDRLARQAALLDAEPDVALVGALASTIGPDGEDLRAPDYGALLGRPAMPPFPHPSIMFRRSVFDAIGGYFAEAARWEDVDLALRMAAAGRVLVIPAPLVAVRLSEASSRLTDGGDLDEAMDEMVRAARGLPERRAGRLLPSAFVPAAALRVWRGQRPGIFRRLLGRGRLRPDRESVRTLGWAMLADLSPGGLRALSRRRLARANRRAMREIGEADAVEWRPQAVRRNIRAMTGCASSNLPAGEKRGPLAGPTPPAGS